MILTVLDGTFAICRLSSDEASEPDGPDWVDRTAFSSVTRTTDELSVICRESPVPATIKAERGWRIIKVKGPLDFGLTGVLASLATPLAGARISIFAVSTYDTDYLLVRGESLEAARSTLTAAGFTFT